MQTTGFPKIVFTLQDFLDLGYRENTSKTSYTADGKESSLLTNVRGVVTKQLTSGDYLSSVLGVGTTVSTYFYSDGSITWIEIV